MEKLVSVIIPTHNRASKLIKTIESVVNQDYNKIEIIVIDDGSKDNTTQIINDLSSIYPEKIKFFSFRESMGANSARQKGVELSSGEYIAFLDDDDEWMPEKLSLQVEALENNLDLGAVTSWYYRNTTYSKSNIQVQISKEIKSTYIFWSNFLGSFSLALVKKEIFGKGKILNINLKSSQDWDFWIQILKYSSVGVVGKFLVKYNESGDDRITLDFDNKINGLSEFFNCNKIMMNENQKIYISAKLNDYISFDINKKFIVRIRSKIISMKKYYYLKHQDYNSFNKLVYVFLKFIIPKILKNFIRNRIKNNVSEMIEIHHEKDLYVAKNNISEKINLTPNNFFNIIHISSPNE